MNFIQLKGRFQCLKNLRIAPDRACDIACAILHNIGNIRKRKPTCLIKDKTHLLSSLSFISTVLCKEKPVIQSSFACNKRYYARSAIVLCCSLDKTLIHRLVSFKALWSCTETVFWTLNRLVPIEVHFYAEKFIKNLNFFSTKERMTWTFWMTWGW